MSTSEQVKQFIDRHRKLLAQERQAEIDRSSLLFTNCGPRLLEQKGLALGSLGVVNVNIGLGVKTLIELEQPVAYNSSPIFPPHTFRPGDLARIEPHVSSNAPIKKAKKAPSEMSKSQVEGVVYKVSDTRVVIAVESNDSSSDTFELPERCRILKLANSVTYDRMSKALDQLEAVIDGKPRAPALSPLIQVLLAMKAPSKRRPLPNLIFYDPNLNDSQKAAVRFCLESPEVACIHGPPGTGKTHTLIEIIRQLTSGSKPQRLLVCGASNLAVDNILERLLGLPSEQKIKVTRIGHPARVMNHTGVIESTLEVQASRTDQAALTKDIKNELEEKLATLSGKGKSGKGKAPKGFERKKMWDEVRDLREECRQRERGIVTSVLKDAQIVLATCHSSGGKQLQNLAFDVVIIDEATQAMEPVCWIPIFKGKKLILAGDPKQLPPTVLSMDKKSDAKKPVTGVRKIPAKAKESKKPTTPVPISEDVTAESEGNSSDSNDAAVEEQITVVKSKTTKRTLGIQPPRNLETTLFDRLEKTYGPDIKRMLQVQYRMNKQICDFPSKTMYSGKLESYSSVESHTLSDLPNTQVREGDDDVLTTPVVFFDTAGCEYYERAEGDGDEGSKCNENEVTIVKQWIETLVSAGVQSSQIAVITPYQAQVTLLASLLRPIYNDLEIGTVDGIQGREKDAVIITLVRSNDKREVGFLKDKRRLNVAMTRAKRHLCVVGDSSTVCHGGSFLKKWMLWLEKNADVRYAGLE